MIKLKPLLKESQIKEDLSADLLELLVPVVVAIGLWALSAIPRAIGALVLKIASTVSPKVKEQVDMVKDAIESSVTEDGAINRVKAKQIAKDILTDKEMTSLILKAATTTNVKKKEEYLKSFNEYMQAKYPDSDRYLKTFIKTYVRQGAAYKSRKNDYKRP